MRSLFSARQTSSIQTFPDSRDGQWVQLEHDSRISRAGQRKGAEAVLESLGIFLLRCLSTIWGLRLTLSSRDVFTCPLQKY